MPDSLQPHGLQPARLLCPWDSPAKNTGVGCHALLQGIFPGLWHLGLLYCITGGLLAIWATREALSSPKAGIKMIMYGFNCQAWEGSELTPEVIYFFTMILHSPQGLSELHCAKGNNPRNQQEKDISWARLTSSRWVTSSLPRLPKTCSGLVPPHTWRSTCENTGKHL